MIHTLLTRCIAGAMLAAGIGSFAVAAPSRRMVESPRTVAPSASRDGDAQSREPDGDSCAVNVTAPALGDYDPLHPTSEKSEGFVNFTNCGRASRGAIITASAGSSASYAARTMLGARNDTLAYNLFLDAGGARVWGDGTQDSSTLEVTISGGSGVGTFYAGYATQVKPTPEGWYSDTIDITIAYQ
jgi:spore coat protein U-like protein